jgi:hypothetical protein
MNLKNREVLVFAVRDIFIYAVRSGVLTMAVLATRA